MKKVKILALISAVITGLLLYLFLSSLAVAAKGKRANVIIAASDIAANTPITAEMLKTVSMPVEALVPRALTDTSQALGKISQDKIYAGEQLLGSKLVTAGESSNKFLAYNIEPGKRAITIAVTNTSGVGFMLVPGNRVDLIGYFKKTNETSTSIVAAIMENITVLAVDNVVAKEGKTKSDQSSYTSITLQLTPEQALKLTMAKAEGEIVAMLRSPLDSTYVSPQKVTLGSVINR